MFSRVQQKTPARYYFAIAGTGDELLFELDFPNETSKQEDSHMLQLISHAAMDVIDEYKWKTRNMYMKLIDEFKEWYVSALLGASCIRFIMVHNDRSEENIKNFLLDMYELYIKYSMNPFYVNNRPIHSSEFERKAKVYAKKYLTL